MSQPVIRVENLSKEYQLGTVSHGTLTHDLQSWWARMRGKEDPNSLLSHHHSTVNAQPSILNPHFLALNNVSFDVQQGEAVGIIGRNGAGKSTLLKILSQVTGPSAGTVKIKGRVASLLEVGTGFHPELTGRENVFLNGAILGMTKIEIQRKFDEIVAFAELDKFIDTPVKRYSSGMYVRLAFAVAAHLEPEILIVDEVLAVGDVQFQKKCLGKMQDVGKEGRTVLFVSHNMGAIKRLCEKVVVLKDGKKIFYGPTNEGISIYLDMNSVDSDVVVWPKDKAPETASARLVCVGILNDGKRVGTEINTEMPIQIQINFEVFKEQKIGTSVLLYNSEGELIFSSISNNEPVWHGKSRPIGLYENTCEIPANFLSTGRYFISIPLWEGHYEEGIVERDVISFYAVEHGLVRGDLPYENQGLVRPYLKWTSEFLGQ